MMSEEKTEFQFTEISATRGISSRFSEGPIEFPFSIGAPNALIPSKCYLRVEMEVYGAGDPSNPGSNAKKPKIYEQIAFADDCCGSLFSNAYCRGGGQNISTCNQYLPQASALKKRVGSTHTWLKSMGKDAWKSEADFTKRVLSVSESNTPVRKSDFEMYKPATPANFLDATVAIATTGQVLGANCAFAASDVGSILVVDGEEYVIRSFNLATGADCVRVSPAPSVNVGTTADWYALRRDMTRTSEGRNQVYALYQPPLGFFNIDQPLGAGDYSLLLTPNVNYRTSCVETKNPNYNATGADTTYQFKVRDIKLFIYTMKMSMPDKITSLPLDEISVQCKPYSNSLQFSVPSSTKAISVWVQQQDSGSNPRVPPSMFKVADNSDLGLRTLQITYANQTKTATPWASGFDTGASDNAPNTNLLLQRYNDTYVATGNALDAVGCESFDDYLKRGCYYHFDFSRDMHNRSTEVQIMTDFHNLDPTCKLFIASWNTRVTDITHSQGLIVAVNSLMI